MHNKVCYLSTGIMDTAFDSQVWPLFETATQSGFEFVHFAMAPFHYMITERYLQKKDELKSTGVQTLYFRQRPPVCKSFLARDTKCIRPFLMKWWGGNEKMVIHCRGHLNAYRGLLLKNMNPKLISIIADLRGAISDEVVQGKGFATSWLGKYLMNFYQRIESQIVVSADAVLCVSNAFKEFLETKYNLRNLMIIPTYVDTSRFNFSKSLRELWRRKLNISERIVLIYSGGVAPWQRIEDTIEMFIKVKKNVKNLFMLFLTQEPSKVRKIIGKKIHRDDLHVSQVPHKEVPGYLCAADVGILLRKDTLTNHVASPIKFSEYMCCGLPCILSKNIGDTAEVIREGKAGIILDTLEKVPTFSEFKKLSTLNREELSKSMQQKYSSKIHLTRILKLYKSLLENGLT